MKVYPPEVGSPAFNVEHDHTLLEVLFEDLQGLFSALISGAEWDGSWEDAQTQWNTLRDDIVKHFTAEEQRVFTVLARVLPDLAGQLTLLGEQHISLRKALARVGAALEIYSGQRDTTTDELMQHWQQFSQLWRVHSDLEWQILNEARDLLASMAPEAGEPKS